MPSNETIELLENVLSSVNESERWQYRAHEKLIKPLYIKKIEDLDKKIKNEKEKVEYYGKDDSNLNKLYNERTYAAQIANKLDRAKNGLSKAEMKYDTKDPIRRRQNALKSFTNAFNDNLYEGLDLPNENKLKNKELHDRINKRTTAKDTTHLHDLKHEAAMILIEALNTLLNE